MLEDKWVVATGESGTDVGVHGVDVSLVDTHAEFGEIGRIVDGHMVQLRMLSPIVV